MDNYTSIMDSLGITNDLSSVPGLSAKYVERLTTESKAGDIVIKTQKQLFGAYLFHCQVPYGYIGCDEQVSAFSAWLKTRGVKPKSDLLSYLCYNSKMILGHDGSRAFFFVSPNFEDLCPGQGIPHDLVIFPLIGKYLLHGRDALKAWLTSTIRTPLKEKTLNTIADHVEEVCARFDSPDEHTCSAQVQSARAKAAALVPPVPRTIMGPTLSSLADTIDALFKTIEDVHKRDAKNYLQARINALY